MLVLALVDGDNLVGQLLKLVRFTNCRESVLNHIFEGNIKEDALRIIVEFQGGNDLLELNGIHGSGLGLPQAGQLVASLVTEISIEVKNIEGCLEGIVILPERVVFLTENVVSPVASISRKERDDKQDL